jgi:competence protein ComEC
MIAHRRSLILYISISGFLIGVATNSFIELSLPAALWILCVFAVVLAVVFVCRGVISMRFVLLPLLFLCIALVGVVRHAYTLSQTAHDPLEAYIGETVVLEGMIIEEPDGRETSIRLTVVPLSLDGTEFERTPQRILVTVPLGGEEFTYGDTLSLSGPLELPENFETDTGREFDYVAYLAKDGIGYQMYRPQIEIVSRGGGNMIKRALLRAKKSFVEHLSSAIPSPHSALAAGILLGTKQSLGKDLQEKFRQAGLVHIVVLSGYNVTIVADCIVKVFSFLPRLLGVAGGILGIIAFALITGSGATVVRASIMACIALIGRTTGREYDLLRALSIAACAMVLHNPRILMSDPSFQLSCMATFALVACTPFFESKLAWLPEKFQIRSCVATTLATQFFLLPLLIYMTGMVSIVSLITNLLVPLVVPSAMGVSFLAGMLGFVGNFIASVIGYGAFLLLQYMLSVVDIFSAIPYAYANLPPVSAWLVFAFYATFMFFFVKRRIFSATAESVTTEPPTSLVAAPP